MNMHVSPAALEAVSLPAQANPAAILAAGRAAAGRIAPLWPLKDFVAVNPFYGLAGFSSAEAALALAKAGGARLTHKTDFYTNALASGVIAAADIAAARRSVGGAEELPGSPAALQHELLALPHAELAPLPTLADAASGLDGRDWAGFVTDRISHWASHHFDEGQSQWRSNAAAPLYAAWRLEALADRTPEIMGLKGFRTTLAALPADPAALLTTAVTVLGLTEDELTDYFHRLLFSLGGWASYARYLGWDGELAGDASHAALIELLAIRLAFDHALAAVFAARGLTEAWRNSFALARHQAYGAEAVRARQLLLLAHHAYEAADQRRLFAALPAAQKKKPAPRVQAVFCIDVRSEVFRRALEAQSPEIETLGFAGFFGAPIAHAPLGGEAQPQVPVLLKPAFTVADKAATPELTLKLADDAALSRKTAKSWKGFQQQAVSCFGFVEVAGAGYGLKLAADALGLARPARKQKPVAPSIDGIEPSSRLAMAENALRGMSLTRAFAPLVLLVGHASESLNNPHASGLDCGACGGHSGEVNARVMAAVLNDPAVRSGLKARGIEIPPATLFLGALHNTTTDEVTVFADMQPLNGSADDLRWTEAQLAGAMKAARAERARKLPGGDLAARAHDFSQVRPEWGLAGCAAFIAAPRRFTAAADLEGRAFLHSYNWGEDEGFKVLELIMTAPVVVASWISLQYFGSTVDNANFGSGNKVLHNAVGTFGVLEGNSGALRTGLAMQSVHDGERFVHSAVRLSVMIAAPLEAMSRIIARHGHVRDLLDNGWLNLIAMDDHGALTHRYAGGGRWDPVGDTNAEAA